MGMTQEAAHGVYDALVTIAGANEIRRDAFVSHYVSDSPSGEWRIQGKLGFGGKFRYPSLKVDCYPEDQTPETGAIIQKTNEALAEFR